MISGRSSETTYEQTENLKPGEDLFGDRGAADDVPALEDQHFAAGARQVRGGGQAVVARADDDRVVLRRHSGTCTRTHGRRLRLAYGARIVRS